MIVAQTFGVFDLVLDSINGAIARLGDEVAGLSVTEVALLVAAAVVLWKVFAARR